MSPVLPVLVAALVAPAPTTTPEDATRARDSNERALEAYEAGRFGEAARLFEAAFAADPHPSLLWNAARAYDLGGELELALDRYERVLAHSETTPDHRQKAAERREILQRLLHPPPPAGPEPDATPGGPAPYAGGAEEPLAPPAAPLPEVAPPSRALELTFASAGGVLLATSGVLLTLAISKASTTEEDDTLTQKQAFAARDSTRRLEASAWATGLAGLGLLTTGAVLYALTPARLSTDSPSALTAPRGSPAVAAPALLPGGTLGVVITVVR